MMKRIAMWVGIVACVYLGYVMVALPWVEHALGLGVYQKNTGVYRK